MDIGLVFFFIIAFMIWTVPVVIVIVVVLLYLNNSKKQQSSFQLLANRRGWTYMFKSNDFATHDNWGEFMSQTGLYRHLLMGSLEKSKSPFVQYWAPRSKTQAVITRAEIQDTKVEFLLTPRNNGFDVLMNGGDKFINDEKHHFEGDFGNLFNVYYSKDEHLDLYTLFGPDVLEFIKNNLRNTSIAVNGRFLFVYTDISSIQERERIIDVLDGLVQELRLGLHTRSGVKADVLARTATDNFYTGVKRISTGYGKKFWLSLGVAFAAFILYWYATGIF